MTAETKLIRNNNLPKFSALPINDNKPFFFFFSEGNAYMEVTYGAFFTLGFFFLAVYTYPVSLVSHHFFL